MAAGAIHLVVTDLVVVGDHLEVAADLLAKATDQLVKPADHLVIAIETEGVPVAVAIAEGATDLHLAEKVETPQMHRPAKEDKEAKEVLETRKEAQDQVKTAEGAGHSAEKVTQLLIRDQQQNKTKLA